MSEITRGAIGMPFEMAMESELSRLQFHSIAQALMVKNERLSGCDKAYVEAWEKARALQSEMDEVVAERDQLKAENELLCSALKAAEDAMWHADGNMDGEAADARDALAAVGSGEQS